MARTICKEVYEYKELSPEAQKKVIEDNYGINVQYEWYDCNYDDWIESLKNYGFHQADINFSGFHSQGDGASFTCKEISVEQWIENSGPQNFGKYRRILKLIKSNAIYITGKVVRDRWTHHVHWNTTSVYLEDNYYGTCITNLDNIKALVVELENDMWQHAKSLNKEIYNDLNETYDYLTSEEAIVETIAANDYEFYENGKKI